MKKKIVIIGSAGNFGKYISKELKKKKYCYRRST